MNGRMEGKKEGEKGSGWQFPFWFFGFLVLWFFGFLVF